MLLSAKFDQPLIKKKKYFIIKEFIKNCFFFRIEVTIMFRVKKMLFMVKCFIHNAQSGVVIAVYHLMQFRQPQKMDFIG